MKTIVLTGATGGLGTVLVEKMIEKKCGELICIYRNEDKFRGKLSEYESVIHSYKMSVDDDYNKVDDIIKGLVTDEIILILNAFSIVPIKSVGEYTLNDIEEMINGNIKQNVVLLNKIVQVCKKNAYKLRIINLDSGAANFPLTGWGNYCAAKAYMNAFLGVISLENQEYKVVSYDPGVMDTDMQKQIRETEKRVFDQVDTFIEYKESGRLVKPDIVAEQLIERYVADWKAIQAREKIKL